MSQAPIGAFDSGVGGLSVVLAIRQLLPGEDLVYLADSAHCPYGDKPLEEIRELAFKAAEFLLERGSKLIVVACNTASAAALADLRSRYPVPFVGMVPAVKPATLSTASRRVGVLATRATIQAELFADLLSQFAEGVEVYPQACPGLVELVEAGRTDLAHSEQLLRRYVEPLLEKGIDRLVLGCTHYPFLRASIESIVGPAVSVIDSGAAIARQVQRVLESRGALSNRGAVGVLRLHTSGDRELFKRTVRALLDGRETFYELADS
ncbi:MAG: glutamate racemase [Chloroflexota bacterium]|nr:MAG: glutamate racemase [Chloroflexota bacterium]